MVAAARRGLMLLIKPSPTAGGLKFVPSSPSLYLSLLRRHSSGQQHSIGDGRAIFPSTQQSALLPVFGLSRCVVASRRTTHGFSPATATGGEGLAGVDEGFRQEKRLSLKRTPVFGFSDGPNWRHRNSRESVGYGHGSVWEAERGGGREMFSRALSNSTGGAAAARSTDEGPKAVKGITDGENGDQRVPGSDQGREISQGSPSKEWLVQPEGNREISQRKEKPALPPFKPQANFYEKHPQARGGGADGRSSQSNRRPPSQFKSDIFGKLPQSRAGVENGGPQANGRQLPFKPKANHYDNLGSPSFSKPKKSLGSPSFIKLKKWYAENMLKPALEAKNANRSGDQNVEKAQPSNESNADGQYSVKSSGDHHAEKAQPSNESNAGAPHYGYQLRKGGLELGQFRRTGDPPQNTGSEGQDSYEKRAPFRGSGALARQTCPDSSSGRNSLNSKQISLEEEKEGVALKFKQISPKDEKEEVALEFKQISPKDEKEEVSLKSKQISPKEEKEEVLNSKQIFPEEKEVTRKYPPRRLEGEKKWQYAVRKKHLGLAGHSRGSTRKVAPQWVDDENLGNEPQGDDWRRKKTAWLCKSIPPLRPRPLVTILNEQRKWLKAEDTIYIIEHLLQIGQTLRAHRVLKWKMQQPWYEFDYEVSSKVAVQLGQDNKLTRTRDIYDAIIQNGKVPNLATYEVLINCYIVDGDKSSLAQAWSLYNQMSKLGGHEPPPTLTYNLFQGLIRKGMAFVDEADDLFKRIKMSGLVCSAEMYNLLIHAHGTKGNNGRVDDLIKEMKETGLPVGLDVYAAILRSCAMDGNVPVGEQAFADLKSTGAKPSPAIYSSLIKMYGKAGLPDKAFQTFELMRETGTIPNLTVYEPMIELAVLSGNRDQAEKLLKEAEEKGTPSLHACYNSVMELYSKSGLLDESERLFNEMESKGYPPNKASFNVLLEAHVRNGLVEKAEAVYESMIRSETVKPNQKTYELIIKLYGEAKDTKKLKEVFKELADKKLDVSEEANRYLEAAVSPKKLEAHRNSKLRLEREEREILAGVLLAGAGVETHDRNRTYELHFRLDPDSEVGLPLINYLYKQFSAWSTEPPTRQPLPDPRDPQRSKMLLAFQTISHGSFRFFAHQYRPSQSPVIPRLIHRWLTPRTLAYWYMYGGTKCPETGGILLNASAYTDKDIMLVVNALKSRSIDCERKRSRIGVAICFSGRSAIWLWGLMEPHILPEVKGLLMPEDGQSGEDFVQEL